MRKKMQTEKSIVQCLIERDPVKGYFPRWISPFVDISNEKKIRESKDILLEQAEPPFPEANDYAMKLLDDLNLIGSPVPNKNKIFSFLVRDIKLRKRQYFVHVDICRKDEKTVSVRQVWYPAAHETGSSWKILSGSIFVLLLVSLICFSLIVHHLKLKSNKEKSLPLKGSDQPAVVCVQKETIPKIDPEREQLKKEKDIFQTRLKGIAEEIEKLSSFPTYNLYSPKIRDLEKTCSLEEKLRSFFAQKELLKDLDYSEILPWIMIEWRGKGSVPDIDRILLTNQDGKALSKFLEEMNRQSRLEKTKND